jgi:tetratricopeptide (TPR) repeat protein
MAGHVEEAIAELEQAVALSGGEANDRALLATAYAAAGRKREAVAMAELLAESSGFVPAAAIAGLYTALGETNVALGWLRRALALKDTDIKYLKVDPRFDALRDVPEFKMILVQAGF